MWKALNSPIIITIIAAAAVFAIMKTNARPMLATEVQGAYDEINRILKEGKSDAEKSRAIQAFAQEMATQVRKGFQAGFDQGKKKDEVDPDVLFLATRKKITVGGVKYVTSEWQNGENFLFKIKNNSDKYLSSIRVCCEYYKKGELIDCRTEWLSNIRILEPQQEVIVNQSRNLPQSSATDPKAKKAEQEQYKSDTVRLTVAMFDIKKIK